MPSATNPNATVAADTPLHALPATALATLYGSERASPVDVAEDLIAHIARWEPHIHALYRYDEGSLRRQAEASAQRWRAGEARGPLDGVPVTIKENIATQGSPVPLGSAVTELKPAEADAPPAARLREAGALIVAKTTMPDWGMLSSGLSSFHALTRNPWDLRMNPGGSSAGAGAAAAAGYGPLHLGTDIGGSIRLPAAWCGVVGFKPSLGRLPINPPYHGRCAGPMTRTVADAALAMTVLSRPDWRDTMSLPPQDLPWLTLDSGTLKGKRLGLLLDAGWGSRPDPQVIAAVTAAARRFEEAGCEIVPIAPFTTRAMADGLDSFWRMRSWLDWQALPADRRDKLLPYIRDWIARGERLTGPEVFRGFSQMGVIRDATVAACQPYDYVLSPVSPGISFPAEWASPINDPEKPFEHIAFTVPYNMSEQPAIAVPCSVSDAGFPIGLQIAGRRHDDVGVLRMAAAWEQLRDPMPAWPVAP